MSDRAFLLRGNVQGRGVRPTTARRARQLGLMGYVYNCGQGVGIVASGSDKALQAFETWLHSKFQVLRQPVPPTPQLESFEILQSLTASILGTDVPVDTVCCSECLSEVVDTDPSHDPRRYGYLFNSCVQCGPRYSVISQMPFDRHRTTMQDFPLCKACQEDYKDVENRRFHGQTISCAHCGPRAWITDQCGERITTESLETGQLETESLQRASQETGLSNIQMIADALTGGKVVSIKGIGGYQLLCDAGNDESITRLRQIKRRPRKPLAVMSQNLPSARTLADINELEEHELLLSENPIVLLRSKFNSKISTLVHPGLKEIGILLPTSPLHWLIAKRCDRPLVVTSGNVSDMPIAANEDEAQDQLENVITLHHDREIHHPVDDSVTRISGSRPITIRSARGFTPRVWHAEPGPCLLAVGGHQKVSIAIRTEDKLVMGPHLGDMNSEATRHRFIQSFEQMKQLYGITPQAIVSDEHPDFFTTQFAVKQNLPTIRVQHHHAHIAGAMLDTGKTDCTVLGFAMDGTGYGGSNTACVPQSPGISMPLEDRTIWGGEVLRCTTATYQRVAHLRPFLLPGGETAITQPWRTALALIDQLPAENHFNHLLEQTSQNVTAKLFRNTYRTAPLTTSMGRLFDGISALILEHYETTYEGESAILLEATCDLSETGFYAFDFEQGNPVSIDWRPVVRSVLADLNRISRERIAMKFHRSVANLILDLSQRWHDAAAVLSGGVFQNAVLMDLLNQLSEEKTCQLDHPSRLPIGDGGLSIGQLVVASAILGHDNEYQPSKFETP
ncbi:MAG: carbamoyltransferase HypF [Rubripirellula sp.]|nr:carbamoyltransferase HypF [Rubripirellula sp.]